MTKLSMDVNGVFVPFRSLPAALQRFCRPAFFHHEDEDVTDLSRIGSTIQLRYRDANFAVCARHQLGKGAAKVDAAQFTLAVMDSNGAAMGLSPNCATSVAVDDNSNLDDLLILSFEDWRGSRDLRPHFLKVNLEAHLDELATDAVKAIFTIGYPYALSDVDVRLDATGALQAMSIKTASARLFLQPAADEEVWDTPNRRVLSPHSSYDQEELLDPDGFSGSPVFFIWLDRQKHAQLGFAGIVTNARRDRYAVYDAKHIKAVLDQVIGENAGPQ